MQLLPPNLLYVQRFKEHLRDFGELNDIVVVVKAPDLGWPSATPTAWPPRSRRCAAPAGSRTGSIPICSRGRPCSISRASGSPRSATPCVPPRSSSRSTPRGPTLPGLFDGIGGEIARRLAEGFVDLGLDKDSDTDAPAGGRFDSGVIDTLLGVVAEGLDGTGELVSPWTRVFTPGGDETRSGYFSSADDRLLFILVEPRRDASNFTDNEHFLEAIRGAITQPASGVSRRAAPV